MSRTFNGSAGFDQIIACAPGALSGMDGGPITVAVLWRPSEILNGGIIQARRAGNPVWGLQTVSDGKYYIENDFGGEASYVVGQWQIYAYTKASGSAAVRGHLYRYDTGTWAHTGYGNVGDGTAPSDEIWIGRCHGRMDGDWVATAVWGSVLSDAGIEAVLSPAALANWLAGSPAALWAGNQATTAQAIADLTGNGADQTSIIGTPPPVSADEPPGWSYTLGGVVTPAGRGAPTGRSGTGSLTVRRRSTVTSVPSPGVTLR